MKGVLQAAQAYSATKGSGRFRQAEQTGTRPNSLSGVSHILQLSGKTSEKRREENRRTNGPGRNDDFGASSRSKWRLEKTHLRRMYHFIPQMYYAGRGSASPGLSYEPVREKSDSNPVSDEPRFGGSCAFPQSRSPKAARFFPMVVLGAIGLPSMSAL